MAIGWVDEKLVNYVLGKSLERRPEESALVSGMGNSIERGVRKRLRSCADFEVRGVGETVMRRVEKLTLGLTYRWRVL